MDVTIVDGDDVSATFTVFFDDTSAGAASLKSMQEAAAAKAPLALFGLNCSPRGSKCEFKTSQSFFWEKAEGAYAKLQRLQNDAPDVLQATCTSITAEWTPSSTARDYTTELATHTVRGCLAAFVYPLAGGEIVTDEALGQQGSTSHPGDGICNLLPKGWTSTCLGGGPR